MGLHSHSNKEVRKRKYADQFAKTVENKKRKALKRQRKFKRKGENKMKKENGNGLVAGFITFFMLALFIIFIIMFGSIRFDYASGSHRITPTAIDTDWYGNYKVYYKTSEYTKNSDEDYYYIEKGNEELADEIREIIKQGKTILAYYDQYTGWKGWGAPDSSPIVRIEVLE